MFIEKRRRSKVRLRPAACPVGRESNGVLFYLLLYTCYGSAINLLTIESIISSRSFLTYYPEKSGMGLLFMSLLTHLISAGCFCR